MQDSGEVAQAQFDGRLADGPSKPKSTVLSEIEEATVRAFHYETLDRLKAHLDAFIAAYNFAKHLKSLRWRTPFQAICDAWTKQPDPFTINPHQLIPGLHT
jgi:hypothetical protein